uniref:Dynamin-type G domain-containing protein n=1 Tax=Haptolina brevifila TaxID=156173 RepID=A0A6U7IE30_9EUKA|mmetsp:Transcript_58560/g.116292  ORF Transcript_58560/g.116292 Transcript_58560/m.116292 type:complete len:372 (+) Transcript_58560:172-1287(+)
MKFHPHLQPDLEQYAPSIYNGLQTEISTSKERSFPLITFIDTPGLVDGSFHYPFPVEDAILSVAKHTDLIYIFFDPIGQALCDRTMKVIERLNQDHAEKLRYFLSKADTVPNERDRQKVVVQITQNLSSRVRNAHAFELPSLYIPGCSEKLCSIDNILDATCHEMQQTINQSVQNNLNKLEADCKRVSNRIDELLSADKIARRHNRRAFCRGFVTFLASLIAPLLLVAFLIHRTGLIKHELLTATIPEHMLAHFGDTCDAIVAPEPAAATALPAGSIDETLGVESADHTHATTGTGASSGLLTLPQLMFGLLGCFLALQMLSRMLWQLSPQLAKKEEKHLKATQQFVMTEVLETKARLYKQYLDEVMSEVQ